MALTKKCRHGRGKTGRARLAAWRKCGCAWLADIRVDGRRVYVPLGPDEARARVDHAQLVADREAGRLRPVQNEAGTVRGLTEEWLQRTTAGLKPTSLRNYRARIAVIRRYFGDDTAVARIRTADLAEFREALHSELATSYAHGVYTTLVAVLVWAEAEGLAERVPPPPLQRRRGGHEPAPRERLTIAEAEATIAAIREPRLAVMAELALLTGLRRGELLGLTADAVRTDGTIIVREQVTEFGPSTPKTRSSVRAVGLSPRGHELLRAAVELAEPGEQLFPFHPHFAQQHLRYAMERAGTYRPRRGWHSLRHANAALRDLAGESVRTAAAALGHGANFARTLHYGWAAEATASPALDAARASVSPDAPRESSGG